ncbi:MAG: hypothetical protein C5B52_00385 [Bacteroidetes bacterium]|nr:MAG: hypothetical protein C5B52_00385 [Bacteroidota bacterium]
MRLLSIIFGLAFHSTHAFSQNDSTKIVIPMKDGKVFYERSIGTSQIENLTKTKAGFTEWSKHSFPDSKESVVKADKEKNMVFGTGVFKIVTSESGNYYWMKFNWRYLDGRFQAYDFYEKPIEKGISNEYSKIEYRWWDFRQGKPWSAEDQKLFTGIETGMNTFLSTIENYLGK